MAFIQSVPRVHFNGAMSERSLTKLDASSALQIRGEFMRASRILVNKQQRVSAALAEMCEEREDGLTRAPDIPSRARYAPPPSAYNAIDTRIMRDYYDTSRRYEAAHAGGSAGSFAFEEMARGLGGLGQHNLPTAAMLAPLSQNNGLSPRAANMRVALGFPSTRRFSPGNAPAMTSTQSESGSSSGGYDHPRNASIAASARTSPSFKHALPNGMQSSNGPTLLGEAFAFGSEISFGSERFRLHPHSGGGLGLAPPRTDIPGARISRSFSDGLNRSKSLPRPIVVDDQHRRSSTPLRSEPPSPKVGPESGSSRAQSRAYASGTMIYAPASSQQPTGSALHVNTAQLQHPRRSSSNGGRHSPLAPPEAGAPLGPGQTSPYTSHSPWSFLQPSAAYAAAQAQAQAQAHAQIQSQGQGQAHLQAQIQGHMPYVTGQPLQSSPGQLYGFHNVGSEAQEFSLDDDNDSGSAISESMLDELSRVSMLEQEAKSPRATPVQVEEPEEIAQDGAGSGNGNGNGAEAAAEDGDGNDSASGSARAALRLPAMVESRLLKGLAADERFSSSTNATSPTL